MMTADASELPAIKLAFFRSSIPQFLPLIGRKWGLF